MAYIWQSEYIKTCRGKYVHIVRTQWHSDKLFIHISDVLKKPRQNGENGIK